MRCSYTLEGLLDSGHACELHNRLNSSRTLQDEVLIGTLTVFETLMFAAKLRLPTSLSQSAKEEIVNGVITELGLESVRNTYIGNWHIRGISGGQRRRVSIGCELVTSPVLLFLDEPTSGLDSAAAFHVMSSVRRLAENCRTILAVIHQPASETFALFDKLCLLAAGDCVYFGDADRCKSMFEAAGLPVPASRSDPDHFLHVINRDFESEEYDVEANIHSLVKHYKESKVSAAVRAHVTELHANPGTKYEANLNFPSWTYQTVVLTHRTYLNNFRNVGVFWMRLAMYVMLTLGIAFIYFRMGDTWKDVYSRAALLFFTVAFLCFMAVSAFPAFVEDMKVYIRERLNGYYTPSTFVVANTLASAPFILLIAVSSTICVYFISNLRLGSAGVYFVLDLFMSLMVSESLLMAVAPVVPNFLAGIAAGAGIFGMFMLVCGFFQPLGSMPQPIFRYPLSYISFETWSFTGFMRNEFEGTAGWQCPTGLPGGEALTNCSLTGADVLGYYEIMDVDK